MAALRDPRIVLEQMLEAIVDIEQITAGRSFAAFAVDRPIRRGSSAALRLSPKRPVACRGA